MKPITTLLTILFISLLSSPSLSDQSLESYSDESFEAKGSMSCKVKFNSIIDLEDGIPKSYTNYTNRFKVGDRMTLSYGDISYSDLENVGSGIIKYLDDQVVNIFFKILLTNEDQRNDGFDDVFIIANGEKRVTLREDGFFIQDHEHFVSFFFSQDRIEYSDLDKKITINRYYKNDWEVSVVRISPFYRFRDENPITTQIYTLDCRHKVDKIDEIINFIRSLH
tara:strand:- start:261 stop:929 length:669 start_codon:yes stop_codon:yes gene_type:complete